jgi:1-phosphofructokinase
VTASRVVTLTANPSLDRTLDLPAPLTEGGIVRLAGSSTEPGGKGVNVARAIAAAGGDVVSVLPAAASDPIVTALRALGLELATVPVEAPVRTNYTLVDPAGTTTKLNEPGAALTEATRGALSGILLGHAAAAQWIVLSGSLPPGTPTDWYAELVRSLRGTGARIAVDTSEAPLLALMSAGPAAAPDLLKPNAEELALLAGRPAADLEQDLASVVGAAQTLVGRGTTAVLATLGGAGAVLVTAEGAWHASAPPTTVVSTVGAGDSSLCGYLLAALRGAPPPERLRCAVAYGSAAAGLPGTTLPAPHQVFPEQVTVQSVPVRPDVPVAKSSTP